jgi:hypothetical protein
MFSLVLVVSLGEVSLVVWLELGVGASAELVVVERLLKVLHKVFLALRIGHAALLATVEI